MSSNDLQRKEHTTHKVLSNWRHVVPKFQLEINDHTWPSLGTNTSNKKTCTPKTHVTKLLHSVANVDKLSVSQKLIPVDSAEGSSDTTSCQCEITPNHINHMDSMMSRICIEYTSSKDSKSYVDKIVNSNFVAIQENNEPVAPKRSFDESNQKIISCELKLDCNQCRYKKIDFQNDFPTLNTNKKKINSKSGHVQKQCNDSCEGNLSGNTKKPKTRDPIHINILDVISTVAVKVS